MSSRGRRKTWDLSKEELEQQRADRLKAQDKAKKEKAEKRKKCNKGYGSQARKAYTRRENLITPKPSFSRCEMSNFGPRFPVEGPQASIVFYDEEFNHSVGCESGESINNKMEVPTIFPEDNTKEFIDNQEECLNLLKFTETDFPDKPCKFKQSKIKVKS